MSTATLEMPTTTALDTLPVLPEWITSDTLYEFIDGEYVEKEHTTVKASRIATRISSAINANARKTLGEATDEAFILLPGRTNIYRPDTVYVSYARWPKGKDIEDTDCWRVLPDICIEVISPSDRMSKVRKKMRDYFAAGVSEVWLVLPDDKQIDIYTGIASHRSVVAGQFLDASGIIPGFRLDLADVF